MRSARLVSGTFALTALACVWPGTARTQPGALHAIDTKIVLTMRDTVRRAARPPSGAPLGKVRAIVLDAGHGGENQGAFGVASIHEKFATLDLAYAVRARLEERFPGVRVIMTRYWDRSLKLSERMHLANAAGADLFLSLHYNAATHDRAVGVETFYLTTEQAVPGGAPAQGRPVASRAGGVGAPERPDQAPKPEIAGEALATLKRDLERARQHERSALLAEIVQARMVGATGALDRGVKQANFGVLRGARMPAIVVEAGFLTHPEEGRAIPTEVHRAQVVEALVGAVETFDRAIQ